jgi:diguanylate cyclase (GGDEF)-like protein/PAS domain S-box-containing protein
MMIRCRAILESSAGGGGMKLSIEQKVKISVGLGLALLGAMGLAAYWSVRQLHQINRDYKNVDRAIHAAERLLFNLNDAETSQRGYLLTGQQQYLEPCRLGIAASQQSFKQLSILVGTQPEQVQDLNALQSLIHAKLEELELAITLRQAKGVDAALKVVKGNQSKVDMDKIRAAIQDIKKDIQQQQKVHESRVVDRIQAIALILTSLGLFGVGSIGAAVFIIDRDLKRRYRLEGKLKKSEEYYRSVVASMAEGLVVQDTQGKILDCNQSAAAIAGLSREQILGQTAFDPSWEIVGEDGTPVLGGDRPSLKVLRTGQPQSNVVMGVHQSNAGLRWISTNSEPLWNADKTHPDGVVTTFSDITERKWAEEQVRLVQILALEIGTAKDLTSALWSVLKIVSKNRGFAIGEAWVPCPQSNLLKFQTAWHLEIDAEDTALAACLDDFKTYSESLTFASGTGLPGRVWRSKTPEWRRDIADMSEAMFPRVRVARDVGIKTAVGIPILADQDVLAVLIFLKLEAAPQDDLLIESLTTISAQLGLVLARKQIEDALAESEADLRALFDAMHDLVLIRDAKGRCLRVLSTRSANLVKSPEELLGKTLHETLPKKEADLLLSAIHQCLTFGENVMCDCCLELQGVTRWFSVNMTALSKSTVMSVIRDITERKQLEQALYQEKELAQVTLHSIGDAVITTDAEGNIQYFNPVAEAITGWNKAQTCGLPLSQVFNIINETTREPVDNPVNQALREGRVVGLANHTLLICRDGREIPIEDSAAPIYDSYGNLIGAVLVFHDVTQARSLTKQLSWQASHDPLTLLANRREFERRIEKALLSAQSNEVCHGLCYLDLDQFKIVNDTCGHTAGDELLRQVTTLLQAQVRKTDTLARLGGDEFGVLLDRCPSLQALRIANEMRECIQTFRFVWEEQTFKIGVSIGLTMIDANSKNLSDVLSAADAACYSAKYKGRNRVHVFRTDDQDLLQQRGEMQWATRISRALEEDRFCLYYQTIAPIEPTSQNGEHYEVLLRLRDETGNLVSPMAFIPAAERYGLMHLIDRWVIRALFAAQGSHYREIWNQCAIQGNCCDALYAINLSGASINDDRFIEFLHEQFRFYQIPPQLICFEITETVAIANLTKASQFIRELKQLGCCFALDDFGSGMSSFAYLKHLPVDYLKIDGEFVRHIVDHPVDDAMVEAMSRIGHVMGIKIIAEFVENDAILARLKILGVDYVQGYGIAKPLPLLEPNPVD